MRRDAGQYAATNVSTVAFCHAVFTLRGRAKTQDVFTFDLSHAIVAFYSRDLCMVTLKSFSALRFLPVTLLPDSIVAGLNPFISPMKLRCNAIHDSTVLLQLICYNQANLPIRNQIKPYRVKVVLYH